MKHLNTESVIVIMQNTLDSVDSRLIDHGKRVAWMMFRMLKRQNKYSDIQLRDICVLAMLHDIGAYKTEEIGRMVIFETVDTWEHSIYGYLFLKHFSPLWEYAPAILYHHADCSDVSRLSPSHRELAQMISLCDRADVFLCYSRDISGFYSHVEQKRDIKYSSDVIDAFMAADIRLDVMDEEIQKDKEFLRILYQTPMTEAEVRDYIKMIIFSIDFRSRQTFSHTIATSCIARMLAELSGAGQEEIERIASAAMLHDIGKTGVPLNILESPNRLGEDEMEIMKTHVVMTEKIIAGCVAPDIVAIAIRHHEKLNGSGYPARLTASELSASDRMLAIADIFSALYGARSYKDTYQKEKIIEILSSMSEKKLLDRDMISLTIQRFDSIVERLNSELQPVIKAYNTLNEEYLQIREGVSDVKDICIY